MEFALGVLATVTAAGILSFLRHVWRRYKRHRQRYEAAYETLQKLELGMQESYLRSLLDEPFLSHPIKEATAPLNDGLQEGSEEKERWFRSYRRDGHVVTVLVDEKRTVCCYAVAARDPQFKASISTPLGVVRLNETTMAALGTPSDINYSVGGSGGFGYLVLDSFHGQANAYRYVATTWGRFYGCDKDPMAVAAVEDILGKTDGTYLPSLDIFRQAQRINVVILSYGVLRPDVADTFALETEQEAYRA